mmetsp:Transcript_83406/g.223161  ORF Transcript_83406/g.223161 Transcript_83406/m.223161 type:complete len:212 (-) Transcript_83406:402-1037(-)
MFTDSTSVLRQCFFVWRWRSVHKLHLQIGHSPQPQLPLLHRASGKLVLVDGEAGAVDSNLLTACGVRRDHDVHHRGQARAILIHDHLRARLPVTVQFTIEHRQCGLVIIVDQIASHQPGAGRGHVDHRLAANVKRWEQGQRHDAHRITDRDNPVRPGSFSLADTATADRDPKVEKLVAREERQLEHLVVVQVSMVGFGGEIAIPHQGKRSQ